MTQNDLIKEASDLIDQLLASGERAIAEWVTQRLVEDHRRADRGERAEDLHCWHFTARAAVRTALQKHKLDPEREIDRQLLLPGCQFVQVAYLNVRGEGDSEVMEAIPVEQMTPDDFRSVIGRLRGFATTALKHADELERLARRKYPGFSAAA